MMAFWNGTWENIYMIQNPYGTNKLSPWKVLKKRTQMNNIHIWQNAYYISPVTTDTPRVSFPSASWTNNENRVGIMGLMYSNAREIDNDFGVSVQVSAQHNWPAAFLAIPKQRIFYTM